MPHTLTVVGNAVARKEEENFPAIITAAAAATVKRKKWKLFPVSYYVELQNWAHYHTLASTRSRNFRQLNPTHRNFPRENVVFIFIWALCMFMLSSRFRSSFAQLIPPFLLLLFGIPFKCCEWNEKSEEDNRGKVFIFFFFLLARILSIFPLFSHSRWEVVGFDFSRENFYGFFFFAFLLTIFTELRNTLRGASLRFSEMEWMMTLRDRRVSRSRLQFPPHSNEMKFFMSLRRVVSEKKVNIFLGCVPM